MKNTFLILITLGFIFSVISSLQPVNALVTEKVVEYEFKAFSKRYNCRGDCDYVDFRKVARETNSLVGEAKQELGSKIEIVNMDTNWVSADSGSEPEYLIVSIMVKYPKDSE